MTGVGARTAPAPYTVTVAPRAMVQWCVASGDLTVIAIRVKPGARRPRVGGSHLGVHGPALVVAVSAPAVDGRATEAALRAVADALGLRRADVALRSGETSRDKLVTISAPSTAWLGRLADLRGDATR